MLKISDDCWRAFPTVSQELSFAAIVVLSAAIALFFAVGQSATTIPAGAGVGLWLAALWCDLRSV